MTFVRTALSIAALSTATLSTSVWSASTDRHDSHHPAPTPDATLIAQATPASPGMGMRAGAATPGYAGQMKAMQQMHEKMMAARSPEERDALMAEQLKLMQHGMAMMGGMGGMGPGRAMMGSPGDMAAWQDMMAQRIDMMQSMMQMMLDRMPAVPATK